MKHTIRLPGMLPEGALYRVTYEGKNDVWTYAYDLSTTSEGYDAHVTLGVLKGTAIAQLAREEVRAILVQTTRAMTDITDVSSAWEQEHISCPAELRLRMRLCRSHAAFEDIAARIVRDLPRLREVVITAYYTEP